MRPRTRPSIEGQILPKEIKPLREKLLESQGGICPLCDTLINPEDSALDHCHSQGNVRMVLHRWCNSVLGRVENWSKRVGKTDYITFLKNTVVYLEQQHSSIIHPTHGVPKKRKRSPSKRLTGTKKNAGKSGKKAKVAVRRKRR